MKSFYGAEGANFRLIFHRASIHLIILIDIVYTSRLYRLLNPGLLQPAMLAAASLLIAAYTVYAVVRGYLGRALLVIFGAAFIGSRLYTFSALFGTKLEVNAGFQFILALTFIIFFLVSRDGHRKYLARVVVAYAKIYTCFYVCIGLANMLGVISDQFFEPLLSDDPERGTRIFGHLLAISVAWFDSLRSVVLHARKTNILLLAICAVALGVAQSRVFTLLLVLLTMLFLIRLPEKMIRLACLGVLWGMTAIYLYGFIDKDWNPFQLFSNDTSGSFRQWEYALARDMLINNPVSGVGIPPSQWHVWNFLNYTYFASSDLGTMGIWFDWGLIGLVLFMFGSHVASTKIDGLPPTARTALFLTGGLMAAYGCIAPVIFNQPGATYFGILLGYWLDAYDSQKVMVT